MFRIAHGLRRLASPLTLAAAIMLLAGCASVTPISHLFG